VSDAPQAEQYNREFTLSVPHFGQFIDIFSLALIMHKGAMCGLIIRQVWQNGK
jgi:hypothetical protein